MNIPQIWESFLNEAGHEAIHWSKIGDIRTEDTEIMAWARENQYVVFTHDLDFGSLLYATNAKSPSVIQLRAEHILPEIVGDEPAMWMEHELLLIFFHLFRGGNTPEGECHDPHQGGKGLVQ